MNAIRYYVEAEPGALASGDEDLGIALPRDRAINLRDWYVLRAGYPEARILEDIGDGNLVVVAF